MNWTKKEKYFRGNFKLSILSSGLKFLKACQVYCRGMLHGRYDIRKTKMLQIICTALSKGIFLPLKNSFENKS